MFHRRWHGPCLPPSWHGLCLPGAMAQTMLTSTAHACPADGTPLACVRRWHRPCYARAQAWTLLVAWSLLGARLAWSLLARAAGMFFAWCAAGIDLACGTPLACAAQLAWTLLAAAQCVQRCPKASPKQPACHRAGAAVRCAPLGRYKGPCAPVARPYAPAAQPQGHARSAPCTWCAHVSIGAGTGCACM